MKALSGRAAEVPSGLFLSSTTCDQPAGAGGERMPPADIDNANNNANADSCGGDVAGTADNGHNWFASCKMCTSLRDSKRLFLCLVVSVVFAFSWRIVANNGERLQQQQRLRTQQLQLQELRQKLKESREDESVGGVDGLGRQIAPKEAADARGDQPKQTRSLEDKAGANPKETDTPNLDEDCHCRRLPPVRLLDSMVASTCSRAATARGHGQVVMSYALYGQNKVGYLAGVMKNLQGLRDEYPAGTIMRVYYDKREDDKPETLSKICQLFCENEYLDICNAKTLETFGDISASFGMVWRFAPMADPLVKEWHSRDLDSRITAREFAAVREFRQSNATYHIMRDHYAHVVPIMGGMFGMKINSGNLKLMTDHFKTMLKKSNVRWHKGLDQSVLSSVVYSTAKEDMLMHDSYLCLVYKSRFHRPWPVERIHGPNFTKPEPHTFNFVGSNGGDLGRPVDKLCPKECRPEGHKDWKLC